MNIITKRAILSGALAMAIASGAAIASTSGSASAQTVPNATTPPDFHTLRLAHPVLPTSGTSAYTPGKNSEAYEARYAALEVAADTIGITEEQLDLELHDKSLAQVAEAHGISVTGLKEAIITDATTRIRPGRGGGPDRRESVREEGRSSGAHRSLARPCAWGTATGRRRTPWDEPASGQRHTTTSPPYVEALRLTHQSGRHSTPPPRLIHLRFA